MTLPNSVFVLRAVNTADFNADDVTVVGITREAAQKQFKRVLKDRFENHLDQDDLDFYKTFDNYEDSWHESIDECALVS